MSVNIVRFKNLKTARERAGLSRETLAIRSHVKAQKIERLEGGLPDTDAYFDDLCALAKPLGLKLVQAIQV